MAELPDLSAGRNRSDDTSVLPPIMSLVLVGFLVMAGTLWAMAPRVDKPFPLRAQPDGSPRLAAAMIALERVRLQHLAVETPSPVQTAFDSEAVATLVEFGPALEMYAPRNRAMANLSEVLARDGLIGHTEMLADLIATSKPALSPRQARALVRNVLQAVDENLTETGTALRMITPPPLSPENSTDFDPGVQARQIEAFQTAFYAQSGSVYANAVMLNALRDDLLTFGQDQLASLVAEVIDGLRPAVEFAPIFVVRAALSPDLKLDHPGELATHILHARHVLAKARATLG